MGTITATASAASARRRALEAAVQPFDDAAFESYRSCDPIWLGWQINKAVHFVMDSIEKSANFAFDHFISKAQAFQMLSTGCRDLLDIQISVTARFLR